MTKALLAASEKKVQETGETGPRKSVSWAALAPGEGLVPVEMIMPPLGEHDVELKVRLDRPLPIPSRARCVELHVHQLAPGRGSERTVISSLPRPSPSPFPSHTLSERAITRPPSPT